jgi:hypothetical protein
MNKETGGPAFPTTGVATADEILYYTLMREYVLNKLNKVV